ncbi:MAG: ABC transporter ATP-binding protein/permease [Oscillospiraceae bacterium]|nr:ABC transporter ATP-binding protein/permease [Oscillospiraceae bacterium]
MKKKIKIKKLLSYYKPYKKTLLLDLFFAVLNATVVFGVSFSILKVKDTIVSMPKDEALKVIYALSAFVVVDFVLLYLSDRYVLYYGHVMGAKIERDMKVELFSHLQKLSLDFYDNQKVGQLMSRITTDLNNISEFLHHMPEELTVLGIKILGAFFALFLLNKIIAFVILFMVFVTIVFALYFVPRIHEVFLKEHEKNSKISSQIEETLSGMKVVKSFCNENIEVKKFKKVIEDFIESKKGSYKIFSRFYSLSASFILCAVPIILVLSLFLIVHGSITVSELVTCAVYLDIIIGPFFTIISLVEQFQESIAGYQRFIEILSIEPTISDLEGAIEIKNAKGKISFKDVSFGYNEKEGEIFSHLDLDIQSGEYVALVGTSGVGKSTFCSLIPRLYEASNGVITLDGNDIRNIKIKNLRENIGFVMQDIYLFAGTIRANIEYGKPGSTDEEIILAAKNAFAHDFISELPDGYYTDIGQRGAKLSGGQKQRLAIARVFLKNPPVLILDEATSALDLESEKCVQKSVEELSRGRTTIVIAHRLSTIKKAKRIIVLDTNGIVEQGSHEELIEKKGNYYRLSKLY